MSWTQHFKKACLHKIAVTWISGAIILTLLFMGLRYGAGEHLREHSLWYYSVIIIATAVCSVFCTWPLAAGKPINARWSRRVIFATVPIFASCAFLSVFYGRFALLGMIFCFGGGMAGIRFFPPRSWLAAAPPIYCALAVGFSMHVLEQNLVQALAYNAVTAITSVVLFSMMFLYSNFSRQESALVYDLLRQSRKNRRAVREASEQSERLLLNILPEEVARELKETGRARPRFYDSATIVFTDFRGFTNVAEKMSPAELIEELDRCFSYFDQLMDRYNLEKLKTIGDSYMCAGGVPAANGTHAIDAVLAALEIQSFMNQMKALKLRQNLPYWELRLGIHTGPIVAGVIGEKKFVYDVWGDTVNTASRMETAGEAGRINISKNVYEQIEDLFECEYRGRVQAKSKGEIDMYFVNGLRPEFAEPGEGYNGSRNGVQAPNEAFFERYRRRAAPSISEAGAQA